MGLGRTSGAGSGILQSLLSLMGLTLCAQESDVDWDDLWDQFEERRYLSARRWKGGEDPYRLHAFNQRESERIPSDRAVRDTRHHRFCLPLAPPGLPRQTSWHGGVVLFPFRAVVLGCHWVLLGLGLPGLCFWNGIFPFA